jgi:ankyrin repeat protein
MLTNSIIRRYLLQDRLNVSMLDSKGRSLLHLAAERGNLTFWNLLTVRPDVDTLLRDNEGNTPLMVAVASGQEAILTVWLAQVKAMMMADSGGHYQQGLDLILTLQNGRGENLFMLVIRHMSDTLIKYFIATLNLTACIDQRDAAGSSGLLLLCSLDKWQLVEQLLTDPQLDEVAMDVHPTDKSGNSALALALMERAKAERQLQAAKAKFGNLGEERTAKQSVERQLRVVKLLVAKERDLHGLNLTTGRDVGVTCIKQQMECNRRIRPPYPEEVLQEFTSLYNVVFRAKKKPEPVPKLEEVEAPRRQLAVSSFQQAINNIYKESQNGAGTTASSIESLKLKTNGTSKESSQQSRSKTNFNDLEFDYYGETVVDRKKEKKLEDINGNVEVHLNGSAKEIPAPAAATEPAMARGETEPEPSVAEIRAQWKLKRTNMDPEEEERKKRTEVAFDSESFFESLLKKHEQEKPAAVEEDLEERMNEEILWALQQKREAEQEAMKRDEAKRQEHGPNNYKDTKP